MKLLGPRREKGGGGKKRWRGEKERIGMRMMMRSEGMTKQVGGKDEEGMR